MRVIAAYMLAVLGGNESPDAKTITEILSSVGVKADDADIAAVVAQLKGKNLDDLLKEGTAKLAAVPTGGGGGAAAPAAAAAAAPAAAGKAPAAAGKKEAPPPKEESPEEEDAGFSLFD